MEYLYKILALFAVLVTSEVALSHRLPVVPVKHAQRHKINSARVGKLVLDGNYYISWHINEGQKSIHFEVTAETKGSVGFRLKSNDALVNADIFIAGVHSNGTKYGVDYYDIGYLTPLVDAQQDYILDNAAETDTNTTIKFHRLLNTCDDKDLEIKDEAIRLVLFTGETDDVTYLGSESSTTVIFFTDNEDFDPSNLETLELLATNLMPAEKTAYWCTINAVVTNIASQYVVSLEPVLNSTDAIEHIHQITLRRCRVPKNGNPLTLLHPWRGVGDNCFQPKNASFPYRRYCSADTIYVWTKGDRRTVFPPDIALRLYDADEPAISWYHYALEIHYDNPEKVEGKKFTTGIRLNYTSERRPIQAGLLSVSHLTDIQLTIPPQTSNYVVAGHCSSNCTERLLPQEGIRVFTNLLSAHVAGRKMKLRHFRGTEELPWLDTESYYDFEFNSNKILNATRNVVRGDQLTLECSYDSTQAYGQRAIIGGPSSNEERCQAWMYYYPRQVSFLGCGSVQNLTNHMSLLGITKWEERNPYFPGGPNAYNILEPVTLSGDYVQSVSSKVNWSPEFREKFQEEKRFNEQLAQCITNDIPVVITDEVKYPENIKEYEPENNCEGFSNTPPATSYPSSTTSNLPPTTSDRPQTTSDLPITTTVFSSTTSDITLSTLLPSTTPELPLTTSDLSPSTSLTSATSNLPSTSLNPVTTEYPTPTTSSSHSTTDTSSNSTTEIPPVTTTLKCETDDCSDGTGGKIVKFIIVAINSTLNFNFNL